MHFSKRIYVFRVSLAICTVSLNVVCRSVVCEVGKEFVAYECIIAMQVGLQMVK
jgi:hypothetical protein